MGLGRTFKIMDDDGSHTLTFPEFKKGMHDYGVYLNEDKVVIRWHLGCCALIADKSGLQSVFRQV